MLVTVEDEQRKAISTELARIEEGAEYSSNSQFEQAKLWRGTNLVLGVPAAVLAAVAGATALASTTGRVAAGILALCAAGLGAVMTTLNAARRAEQAHVAGNAYLGLRNDARRLRTIDLPAQPVDEARQALEELTGRETEINNGAPIPSRLAFRLGKRNIARGGTTYRVDQAASQKEVGQGDAGHGEADGR
jgi:hypothetical protein